MTATEETAHAPVVQRQWALRKAAAGQQHRKVVDGRFVAYSVEVPPAPLVPGQQTADGVYAGLTSDGKQQIFTMPKDLDVVMTFNAAAAAVETLNTVKALGHSDWQIPSLENLRVLQKNQNEGALKGTFNTSNKGSDSDYWSSSSHRVYPIHVVYVRFSDGYENWYHTDDDRLSCRPVRLVAPTGPSLT